MRTFLRAAGPLLLLASAAVRAEDVQPMIARPLTLPRNTTDVTLNLTYTNWAPSALGGGIGSSLDGEILAAAADFGVSDRGQLGFAVALPINPGAGFGSILASAAIAAVRDAALRVDAGYERIGFNGNASDHTDRFFAGLGASIRVPITPTLAFVTRRTGAANFGQFSNVGAGGTGLYYGASGLSEGSSDFLVFSGGTNNSSTNIGINLPIGLLLQPDPHVALTLQTGYSTVIEVPSAGSGSTQTLHFIPLGVEAVVSPTNALDLGARFFLDGYVAQTGASGGAPGYFDLRTVLFWFRVHV